MKIKELREKSLDELMQTEQLYKEELLNLRMQSTTKQLEKPSRVRDLRRGIAKIKTLIREEEIKNPEAVAKILAPKKSEAKKIEKAEAKKTEKTETKKTEKAEKAEKKK